MEFIAGVVVGAFVLAVVLLCADNWADSAFESLTRALRYSVAAARERRHARRDLEHAKSLRVWRDFQSSAGSTTLSDRSP